MAKDKITEYDATASNNTVCGDVNIAENSALPSDMNNFAREIMSHLKEGLGSGTPLYVDQTNNRLGINTSSPSVDLDISGGLSVDGGTIKLDGNYPTGTSNVALGDTALDDGSLSGNNNTAIGSGALTANTTGNENTAIGYNALDANTTANENTAIGYNALTTNTTGSPNTAVGKSALGLTTTGGNNVAVGSDSFDANTTGYRNTGLGHDSGGQITTGFKNTAIGTFSYNSATTADSSTCVGHASGNATTGGSNTFIGESAGSTVTSGTKNTIIGRYNGNLGGLDIRTASNNIVLSDGDGSPRLVIKGDYTKISPNYSTMSRANDSSHVLHQDNADISVFIENTNVNNPYGLYIDFSANADDDNGTYFINCADSSATRFQVMNQGDVRNHDNSYGAISDVKLKEQITDASSQWEDIKALTVRKYKMKEDVSIKGDSDELWRLGVVAQEVEEAGMGGLVSTDIDRDKEMNDLGTTTKTVKYSILYMKAVKALQEAMERIETLEQKVATLEGA